MKSSSDLVHAHLPAFVLRPYDGIRFSTPTCITSANCSDPTVNAPDFVITNARVRAESCEPIGNYMVRGADREVRLKCRLPLLQSTIEEANELSYSTHLCDIIGNFRLHTARCRIIIIIIIIIIIAFITQTACHVVAGAAV